ncbi:hypothetical protein Cpir12675_000037 [Ceratocystis pirilliformis]|uniref:Reverse transcriptase Ty1/copia-type domain-containing protein n=1 Tax=Ceratocystis pirilliformis TaxID=259994 RepID=A0ABR3ZN66_9PEZI
MSPSPATTRPGAQDSESATHNEDLTVNGTPIIANRWVFTRKSDKSFKARLVAKGFSEPFVTAQMAYADTAHIVSIRALVAYAAVKKYQVRTADITAAYLQAELDTRNGHKAEQTHIWFENRRKTLATTSEGHSHIHRLRSP